jgi:hypothetical protein
MVVPRVSEAGHPHPVLSQPLQVDIGGDQFGGGRETCSLGEPLAVLVDQRVAVPRQVRGGLAGTGGGVQVGGDAARRL